MRRLDVEIASKCVGATFSLTGDDGAELFEGVEYFNYFWRVLHQTEEEWTAVLWISREQPDGKMRTEHVDEVEAT